LTASEPFWVLLILRGVLEAVEFRVK
jgi:hypothetical protein